MWERHAFSSCELQLAHRTECRVAFEVAVSRDAREKERVDRHVRLRLVIDLHGLSLISGPAKLRLVGSSVHSPRPHFRVEEVRSHSE